MALWEGSKGGGAAPRAGAGIVAVYVANACAGLELLELITIGTSGDPHCFDAPHACRDTVADTLGMPAEQLRAGALSISMLHHRTQHSPATHWRVGWSTVAASGA